jgi:hypothetical protein
MSEPTINSFRQLSTEEGEIRFGDSTKNGVKMAVMIRRIFPSAKFQTSQYIALQMSGALDGAIIASAPSLFTVLCGEKPVKLDSQNDFGLNSKDKSEGVAAYIRAENGDIILSAPNGRIKLQARDIDLISTGNGDTTGFINMRANASLDVDSPTIAMQAADSIALGSERNLNLNASGRIKQSCGSFKLIEAPDVSIVTSPLGSGSNTILQTAEGLLKLIQSIA